MGPSAASFAREYLRLLAGERDAAARKKPTSYTLCELALLRLVCDGASLARSGDSVAAEHLRAAKPFFRDFVDRQMRWASRGVREPSVPATMEEVEAATYEEFVCSVCFQSLANIVLTAPDGLRYCGDCAPNGCSGRARFFSMGQLQAMRDAQ